jgi:hypothetical protein
MIKPAFYPARPVNGGPLPKALAKSGDWSLEGKYNGWRAWVHNPTGAMFNRKLEPLSISHEFKSALAKLHALPWEPGTHDVPTQPERNRCRGMVEQSWPDLSETLRTIESDAGFNVEGN